MTVVELLFFFFVSMMVGNSSNRTLHSICGSLSIASSLMLDGRMSTLLKCSAHLPKMDSLSAMWWLQNSLDHKWFPAHLEKTLPITS